VSEANSKAPRSQRAYNTNLASEFYVMSVLYRLGLDANLTLGNKKAVDIVVVLAPGDTVTIDVKAVAGAVDWLVGSTVDSPRDRHFVVLLSYEGKFANLDTMPKAWVLPHEEFLRLVKTAKAPSVLRYVSRAQVRRLENRKDAWHLLKEK
jgi:hypothetical protein